MPHKDIHVRRAYVERKRRERAELIARSSDDHIDCHVCGRTFKNRRSLSVHRNREARCAVGDMRRFMERVDRSGNCWTWIGGHDPDGYGIFHSGGKSVRASRWLYQQLSGDLPDGMLVCHSCDNPSCVNPEHFFIGSHSDNMADCIAKGRHTSQNFPRSSLGTFSALGCHING